MATQSVARERYGGRIVFKFRDSVEIPYEDGVQAHIETRGLGTWNRLVFRP